MGDRQRACVSSYGCRCACIPCLHGEVTFSQVAHATRRPQVRKLRFPTARPWQNVIHMERNRRAPVATILTVKLSLRNTFNRSDGPAMREPRGSVRKRRDDFSTTRPALLVGGRGLRANAQRSDDPHELMEPVLRSWPVSSTRPEGGQTSRRWPSPNVGHLRRKARRPGLVLGNEERWRQALADRTLVF
jgi:hypothetical protein